MTFSYSLNRILIKKTLNINIILDRIPGKGTSTVNVFYAFFAIPEAWFGNPGMSSGQGAPLW